MHGTFPPLNQTHSEALVSPSQLKGKKDKMFALSKYDTKEDHPLIHKDSMQAPEQSSPLVNSPDHNTQTSLAAPSYKLPSSTKAIIKPVHKRPNNLGSKAITSTKSASNTNPTKRKVIEIPAIPSKVSESYT